MKAEWPKIFTDEDFAYPTELNRIDCAVADGLCGWALCLAGNKPPEFFGKAIVKIGIISGVQPATGDNLDKFADKILAERTGR